MEIFNSDNLASQNPPGNRDLYEKNRSLDWEALYKEAYPMVLHWLLERKAPYDWAKEICHDAFLILFRKLNDPLFHLECKPATFIVAVAKKLYLNQIRKEKNSLLSNIVEKDFPDSEVLNIHMILEENRQKEIQISRMKDALEQLGQPCKELLEDFYFRNSDMQSIAEKFGYTNTDNAKTQKYKCLQRLKKYFFNKKEE
ncbi:MAG: sigma-70 family RNA polymerase sigma factor [Bacteroidia bacterium]|nr:sigma-70 family RNA polymerase sigma factor [Bacteroidia bacterium]